MSTDKAKIIAMAAILMTGFAGVSVAEDIGKREYDNNCAVCHGAMPANR